MTKTCPLCGTVKDDGKEFRTAIYVKDVRVSIIPSGTATIQELNKIIDGTPDSFLMIEVLDKDGKLLYSKRAGESKLVQINGKYVKRETSTRNKS